MISHAEFMIDCGNKMKKLLTEEFAMMNKIVLMNKEMKKKYPSLCNTHLIRMYIAKMKIINGHLKTDADYMEKQHEIFKKHAMVVIEEHETGDMLVAICNPETMDTSDSHIYNDEGGYLHVCNLIKKDNDLIEDYIDTVKNMNKLNLHF